jgi:hypothetical protein
MTIQDLIDWANANGVGLDDTHIALRSKDDHFLTIEGISLDQAYFGNCHAGMEWEEENTPMVDGELDYENTPKVLILDGFSE